MGVLSCVRTFASYRMKYTMRIECLWVARLIAFVADFQTCSSSFSTKTDHHVASTQYLPKTVSLFYASLRLPSALHVEEILLHTTCKQERWNFIMPFPSLVSCVIVLVRVLASCRVTLTPLFVPLRLVVSRCRADHRLLSLPLLSAHMSSSC